VQKQNTNTAQRRTAQAFDGSNSLADLAARIRAFHQATAEALRRSVENAMAAGDLPIEAKAQLKHGQWLPWLRDHCAMSERTAQLYMRCAKNRAAIEEQVKSATVADLTLNEAAAVLVLISDMRKVINFAREMEHLSGEELIEHCIAEGVGVVVDASYDMFAGRSDAEKLEWHWFVAFLSYDGDAGRGGGEPQCVGLHRVPTARTVPKRDRIARRERGQISRILWHRLAVRTVQGRLGRVSRSTSRLHAGRCRRCA
jgi:hypothetical protein